MAFIAKYTDMPISKKDRIAREHKKADAEGTRAAVKPNGQPVKAAKEKRYEPRLSASQLLGASSES